MNVLFDHQFLESGTYEEKRYFDGLIGVLKDMSKEDRILFPEKYSDKNNAISRISNDIVLRKALSQGADILHITGDRPRNLKKMKEMSGIKKVITIGSLLPEEGFMNISEERKKLIDMADGIIFTSKAVQECFGHFYPGTLKKSTVIFPGYSQSEPKECEVKVPYFLYVGDRERHDNFAIIMDAFSQVHKSFPTFTLVCAGGKEFTGSETARFKVMGYENNIVHVSPSEEELVWLIQNATYLIYPPLTNMTGTQVLDARHSGCPTILSSTLSNHEIAGKTAVFFSPSDPEELAEKMMDMIMNWEEHSETEEGIQSWADAAGQMMEFYRSFFEDVVQFPKN
nr:glycosyltransferase [uncultured Butyrivibrio sp.]